ncbi:tRNA uracil 4-sulfurtransferase ThiI [Gudongella oleilytica]|uniref:tRNA uracil 4-sulfurtransferase ThiI n=1 Tax=Gudongella oleilytica TaxID=1582259 RepID=UPI000FF8A2C2|nr:tRNA uracil 4-sulfurtransferase ThiI [Gudongella oleilytica]MDY0255559.1 tRNA uracil 4-sulfurtransferase ThiI [Gudongella oleilytica]
MDRVLSVSLGEVVLKGLNRKYFEDKLIKNIRRALEGLVDISIYKEQGKIYIEGLEGYEEIATNRLKKVFGLVYISPCIRTTTDMEDMRQAALLAVKEFTDQVDKAFTFKVDVTRSDKRYPLKSPDISRDIGGYILKNSGNLRVDVHAPQILVKVDVKEKGYVYTKRDKAFGGLPVGTNGRGLLLLSGGIDSPVAGFLMAKRGVDIDCIHFHSYPFTSERAEEKIYDLARIMARYTGPLKIFSVNLLNIQKEIGRSCPEDEMTIISRRFMMRIAEKLAAPRGYDALITGENLGQVASQTIQSVDVINRSVEIPILRPLIGMDKVDIIKWSKDIETYETSIQPFEDCCSVFLPKHPVTKPKLIDILNSESNLDIDGLIEDALSNLKIVNIE